MRVIKPPQPIESDTKSLFLAGSIEMGTAVNWQEKVEKLLQDTSWTILNPRRDAWDHSWKQEITDPNFKEQVEWELEAQESATKILMYIDPATKAPISLLELGLFAKSKKLIVVCPAGFWRKGNVDIVCQRYQIEAADTIEEAIELLTKYENN